MNVIFKEHLNIAYHLTESIEKFNQASLKISYAPQPVSDEINQINLRIGETVKTMSWQMVFAKDQAEFDTLWKEMVDKAYGMNAQASIDESKRLYTEALAFGSKYMK